MMSSRVLSRLLPVAEGDVSIFDSKRQDTRNAIDVESQADQLPDEFLREHEDDPDQILFDGADGHNILSSPESRPSLQTSPAFGRQSSKWLGDRRHPKIDEDEDVPESLLLEAKGRPATDLGPAESFTVAGPSTAPVTAEAQWKATQEQHQLHTPRPSAGTIQQHSRSGRTPIFPNLSRTNAETEAMWLYTNATNLDAFLLEVYQYYVEHGADSILLARALSLLTEIFVFSFAMFLTTCIDYSKIPVSHSTKDVVIPQCMAHASWIKNAALFFFVIYVLWRIHQYAGSVRRLFRMRNFFRHVLDVQDQDMQTVSWVRVVDGLVRIQNANIATADQPTKVKSFLKDKYSRPQQRMNAETIANRLMRQANFYVAMYNKDVLDFTLPIPFLGTRQFYSRSLEWCIDFCLTNFIFDEQGSIRPFCLDVKNRKNLVDALRRRLQFAALTSVIVAPVNIVRFCVIYFFRYYTEFTRSPSKASMRAFTPFAEWKIREFNELEHLFHRRLQQAYPFANEYLKQFPKDKTDQICRFVGFVSGAIAAVLTIASLLEPELVLRFEITPGRTAIFWWGIMIGIWGFAHGSLPDENEVHDPVLHLKEVLMFMHYMPAHWKGRLHSNEVRSEFSAMYQLRILIFVEEILSLILAPWILLRNANDRSERIVDFFREHTVHVDGIGYQCNFAVFGFKKNLNAEDPTTVLTERDGLRDDYFGLKDDKMATSVHNFMQYYSHYKHRQTNRRLPGWQPPPSWPAIISSTVQERRAQSPSDARSHQVKSTYGRTSDFLHPRQPPSSAPRVSHQAGVQHRDRRMGASRQIEAHAKQKRRASPSEHHISESHLMAQDSDLSDFDGLPGGEVLESETETGEDAPMGNAGVLGMLYQYSKAQTDKGAGVNI